MGVYINLFPASNSVPITLPDNDLRILGQAPYVQQKQEWQEHSLPYYQWVKMDDSGIGATPDTLTILTHTQNDFSIGGVSVVCATPQLFLCFGGDPCQTLADGSPNPKYSPPVPVAGVDLNSPPYFKGVQIIAGNDYISNDFPAQLKSCMWSFSPADFPAQVTEGGLYYLRFDNYSTATIFDGAPLVSLYSEPMFFASASIGAMKHTRLFEFMYNTNISLKNIIITNWFDDYPTNTVQFNPIWAHRCEAYVNKYTPKGIVIGYQQQSYNPLQVKALQKRVRELTVGENSLGIPYYMLEMTTEALLADSLFIDEYQYVLFMSNSPNLTDIWKTIKDEDVPTLIKARTLLMQASDSQNAIVSPTPAVYPRIFTEEFDDTFA